MAGAFGDTGPEDQRVLAWFHAVEDEISHRGQIRWLRKRLPIPGSTRGGA